MNVEGGPRSKENPRLTILFIFRIKSTTGFFYNINMTMSHVDPFILIRCVTKLKFNNKNPINFLLQTINISTKKLGIYSYNMNYSSNFIKI